MLHFIFQFKRCSTHGLATWLKMADVEQNECVIMLIAVWRDGNNTAILTINNTMTNFNVTELQIKFWSIG